MNFSVTIRPERPDHPGVVTLLDALDSYLASLYPPEANHILDVQALLAENVRFVVAWQGERPVACGAVRRMPGDVDTHGAPYGEVKRMFVHPDVRGQRIGERVIRTLEDGLRADGLQLALLETGEAQPAALRLYERLGYVRRGPFGGYSDNGLSVFYERWLS